MRRVRQIACKVLRQIICKVTAIVQHILLSREKGSEANAYFEFKFDKLRFKKDNCLVSPDSSLTQDELREMIARLDFVKDRLTAALEPQFRVLPPDAYRREERRFTHHDFRPAIASALLDAGGYATTAEVLSGVEARHSRDFGPRELKPLGSGQKRWAIQAQHEGHEMRREQFLEQGTLRGRWRLTPAGKKYAETHYVRVPEPS